MVMRLWIEGDDGLDATNLRLLAELQADARRQPRRARPARRPDAPAVAERLQRLEERGVIRGYHADVDPRALGYALTAILRIRPAPRAAAGGRRGRAARRRRWWSATA